MLRELFFRLISPIIQNFAQTKIRGFEISPFFQSWMRFALNDDVVLAGNFTPMFH